MAAPPPRGHYERTGAPLAWLGTVRDAVLAERLGLREGHVRDARRRHGVPSRWNTAWSVDWTLVDPLLGTRPDIQLARDTGISTAMVNERRHKLGVPIYAPERRCACGATFRAYVSGSEQRFCSTDCQYAARFARRRGGHEDLSVALRALRREVRRRA